MRSEKPTQLNADDYLEIVVLLRCAGTHTQLWNAAVCRDSACTRLLLHISKSNKRHEVKNTCSLDRASCAGLTRVDKQKFRAHNEDQKKKKK